jgi:putative transposase
MSSQVTAQKIAHVMEQPDDGASIEDVCRKAGISIETYYHWYKKYGALRPSKAKRMRELEEENSRLKLLVAIMGFNQMRDVSPAPNGYRVSRDELLASYEEVPAAPPVRAPPSAPSARMPRSAPPAGMPPSAPPARAPLPAYAPAPRPAPRAPAPPRAAAPSPPQPGRRFNPREPGRGPQRAARLAAARQTLAKAAHRARIRTAAVLRDAGNEARSQGSPWAYLVNARRALRNLVAQRAHGQRLLLAGIAAGLVGGFAFGMHESAAPEQKPVPVDMTVRFNTYRSYASTMEQGWKKPEAWGTWMAGSSAAVMLGFDGPSRGDVELLVQARAPQSAKPATVVVRFNDAELSRWQLPAQARDLRRRFIVPAAVFNRSSAAQLSFELTDTAEGSEVFGLQSVELRDAVRLSKFRGYLDHCDRDKLVGWAVAEDSAVSVAATVDGQPLQGTLLNVERGDLASHSLPTDAGFELKPSQPITPGATVEVRFANGQRLIGSPCRP